MGFKHNSCNFAFKPGKLTILMDGGAGSSGKGKIGSFITHHADNWQFACLHHSSVVQTEDGPKTIGHIVDSRYNGKVLSINKDGTGTVGYNRILSVSVKVEPRRWVKLMGNKVRDYLKCTEDHLCLVMDNPMNTGVKNFVEAKNVEGKWVVCSIEFEKSGKNVYPLYNTDQLSVLVGSVMGDGHLGKTGRHIITHGSNQYEYLDFMRRVFNGKDIKETSNTGYGDSPCFRLDIPSNAQTKYLREISYINNKKSAIPLLDFIDEKSLAIWYMDDGWLARSSYDGSGRKCSIGLATCGFGEEENIIISNWFFNEFGLTANVRRTNNGHVVLVFGVDDSWKFLKMIAKYVPQCMEYKLPKELRGGEKYEFDNSPLEFGAKKITEVREDGGDKPPYRGLYDIEVENAHNFFANGLNVHNCNAFWPQAGHTVVLDDGTKYFYQTLNSCAYQDHYEKIYIGPGAIIELPALLREIEENNLNEYRLGISPLATILDEKDSLFERGILNFEWEPNKLSDGTMKFGSTAHGSGSCAARKMLRRENVRLAEHVDSLNSFMCDVPKEIMARLDSGQSGLLEVAQGFQLSLHHNFYPFVTGRNCTVSQGLSDILVPTAYAGPLILNFRTYPIRINNKKFIGEDGKHLTWDEVSSGVPHTVYEGNSGPGYPDQREMTWEEVTHLSGSPEPIFEITSVTKLPRRVFSFSKNNLEEAIKYNRTGDNLIISLNFVNYVDHNMYGRGGTCGHTHTEITNKLDEWLTVNFGTTHMQFLRFLGTGPNLSHMLM